MSADLITFPTSEEDRRQLMAGRLKAPATDVAKVLVLDRARITTLITVADQATRFGVEFDLAEAVESGMTVDAAREYVLAVACWDAV